MLTAFMLFVVLFAVAQEPYVFYVGSTHSASVTNHGESSYLWKIYQVDDFADPPEQTEADLSDYEFVGDVNDEAAVSILWNSIGKYYLVVEESAPSGCSTKRARQIEVQENNLNIGFVETTSNDCYDGDNSFAPEIAIKLNETDPLPESLYPITLSYRVEEGETSTDYNDITITYADVGADGLYLLPIDGITEDELQDKVFTITLLTVTDKYDTPINKASGAGSHERTVYQLPQTGTMVQE